MGKSILTIIADDDIIDELAAHSYDDRCFWLTEPVDISDEEFEKYAYDSNTDTNDDFWARVSDEMHDEIIRAYKEWKETSNE